MFNDTWIYNSTNSFCQVDGMDSIQYCTTYRGGLYDISDSSTTKAFGGDVSGAGEDIWDTQRTAGTHIWNGSFAQDDFVVGNLTLPSFPIAMPGWDYGGPYDTQNVLGLGWNSTLLDTLKLTGRIASRSYSWWWGLNGATPAAQMDGSFVIGGYDAAKTTGPNLTESLSASSYQCASGMSVTITGLVLDFPNGTSFNILQAGTTVACLVPDYPYLMTLPLDVLHTFNSASNTVDSGSGGGNGLQFSGMLYDPANVYQGDLTFQLKADTDTFEVRVPNDILIVQPQNIESDGSISTDTSRDLLTINMIQGVNAGDTLKLGRTFFSAAYLNVDFDAETFTLWAANATADTRLVSQGAQCAQPHSNAPSTTNTGSATGSSSATRSSDQSTATGAEEASSTNIASSNGGGTTPHSTPFSPGTIAGIAVGSALGAVLLAAMAVICCLRRRHRRRQSRENGASNDLAAPLKPAPAYVLHGQGYNESASEPVLEMSTQRDPQELASNAKAAAFTYARGIGVRRANEAPVEMG
ncbi:hypothetical protein LTR08_004856 [Meristemomyces frigidus]|nr:hypothetical protein LTR08_004856 [Meristemomyces frigidus]